jgi:glycosyltransferase involved in cell wall biosynthesis
MGRGKFDVFHGQAMIHDGLAAVLLGKIFNRPSVVTAIGSDIHTIKKNSLVYKATLFVLRKATLITTVSADLKQRIVEMGIDERKIIVAPNGVDPQFHKNRSFIDVRQRMNIPPDAKVFGFVGRLIPIKDPMTLLTAFAHLLKQRNDLYLIFVGGGELKDALLQEAKRLNVAAHVRLTEGMVSPHEVPDYMEAFDFLCLSSLGEGWPNVILEAMACGKPVIGTNVGGVPEAIAGEDYGLIVPPQDPVAMADAMRKALDIPWNREDIARYARENSWEKVGARYHEIYRRLCAARKHKRF